MPLSPVLPMDYADHAIRPAKLSWNVISVFRSENGSYGISGLMFVARITFPHFSVSEAISLP